MIRANDRQRVLTETRNLKMARSAHTYVRGSTVKFYEWLDSRRGKLPEGPPVWICGDCHVAILVRSPTQRAVLRFRSGTSIKL
jgi:uncharacterized protein (DUF2252 family)